VWSAAAQAADEPPPENAPPKAPAPVEPASARNFAAEGTWLLSVEDLFGYTYARQSNGLSVNTFTVFGDTLGSTKSQYRYPRMALDYMVGGPISAGLALNAVRMTTSTGGSDTGVQASARVGYALMPGPSFGIWPRLGATYAFQSASSAFGISADLLIVVVAAPHLLFTVGPSGDFGLSGKLKLPANQGGATIDMKYHDIGIYFGMTVPL
jgi:hypothetical protein